MTNEPSPITVPDGIPVLEATSHSPKVEEPELLIITGMSGAGRTKAAETLEDLDWYVVDNLPAQLLTHLVGLIGRDPKRDENRLATVVDVRSRDYFNDFGAVLGKLNEADISYRILFLDAADDVLVRRYESVRRPHPLQADGTIVDGIAAERTVLAPIKELADHVIDTSELNVHDLAKVVREAVVAEDQYQLRISVQAFGFKYGIPLDADHVADVRFLANPYWITELRHLNGNDEPVRDYVLARPGAQEFIDRYVSALEPVLAGYLQEEKRYVTIAVGCTGGKHRSVAISGEIASKLRDQGHVVRLTARDLGKE